MRTVVSVRTAATVATVGFAALSVLQALLAAGAPLGAAAWGGGTEGRLPTGPRIGSAMAVVVYAVAVAIVLRRAGMSARWVPRGFAHVGCWVLVALLTVGSLANFASQSPWERYLLGPVTLVMAGSCLVVARAKGDPLVGSSA